MILLGTDIIVNIFNFIDNKTDLLSIKNSCKYLYNLKYVVKYYENKTYPNIITPLIRITNNPYSLCITQSALLHNLSYITTLDIRGLKKIKFKNINNLKYLYCDDVYASSIKKCKELELLYCKNAQNHLRDNSIHHMVKLTVLQCTSTQFTDNLLYKLKYLEILQITSNCKYSVNGYSQLINLHTIETGGLYLHNSSMIRHIPKLKTIRCSHINNFYDSDIINRTNIEILYATHLCHFTDLSIRTLTNLTVLDVRHQLSVTDISLQYLTNLIELYCPENITGECLLKLPNLKRLYCVYNSFINDNIIVQLDLEELECLFNTSITDNSIKTQSNLQYLVCNSVITEYSIRLLPNLKKINVGYNYNYSSNLFLEKPQLLISLIKTNSSHCRKFCKMLKLMGGKTISS